MIASSLKIVAATVLLAAASCSSSPPAESSPTSSITPFAVEVISTCEFAHPEFDFFDTVSSCSSRTAVAIDDGPVAVFYVRSIDEFSVLGLAFRDFPTSVTGAAVVASSIDGNLVVIAMPRLRGSEIAEVEFAVGAEFVTCRFDTQSRLALNDVCSVAAEA